MSSHPPRGVTRRTLSRVAWSAPALVVFPTARAAVASCGPLPSVAFQGSWSDPFISDFAGRGWKGFRDGTFGGDDDPAQGFLSAVVQTTIQLTLEPSTQYRMTFPVLVWDQSHEQTATFLVFGDPVGNVATATTDSPNPGTIVYDFSTDASPTVELEMYFSIDQHPDGVVPGDNITIGSPTLECA